MYYCFKFNFVGKRCFVIGGGPPSFCMRSAVAAAFAPVSFLAFLPAKQNAPCVLRSFFVSVQLKERATDFVLSMARQADEMLNEVDFDHDGWIMYDEVCQYLMQGDD